MNSPQILANAHASHEGSLSFPQIVQNLLSAGVEYYHVDYPCRTTTYYGGEAHPVVVAIPFPNLPAVAAEWNVDELKRAIRDSQENGQKYRDFSWRAVQAGVQGYFAFLSGHRVTYLGRQGDQHTEWFPGAKPLK